MCGVASSMNTAKYTPPGFIRKKKSKTPWAPQTAGQRQKIHPEKDCFIALNSGFHPIQSESRKNFTGAELLQNLSYNH